MISAKYFLADHRPELLHLSQLQTWTQRRHLRAHQHSLPLFGGRNHVCHAQLLQLVTDCVILGEKATLSSSPRKSKYVRKRRRQRSWALPAYFPKEYSPWHHDTWSQRWFSMTVHLLESKTLICSLSKFIHSYISIDSKPKGKHLW